MKCSICEEDAGENPMKGFGCGGSVSGFDQPQIIVICRKCLA